MTAAPSRDPDLECSDRILGEFELFLARSKTALTGVGCPDSAAVAIIRTICALGFAWFDPAKIQVLN